MRSQNWSQWNGDLCTDPKYLTKEDLGGTFPGNCLSHVGHKVIQKLTRERTGNVSEHLWGLPQDVWPAGSHHAAHTLQSLLWIIFWIFISSECQHHKPHFWGDFHHHCPLFPVFFFPLCSNIVVGKIHSIRNLFLVSFPWFTPGYMLLSNHLNTSWSTAIVVHSHHLLYLRTCDLPRIPWVSLSLLPQKSVSLPWAENSPQGTEFPFSTIARF